MWAFGDRSASDRLCCLPWGLMVEVSYLGSLSFACCLYSCLGDVDFCCILFPLVGEGGKWGSENSENVLRVTPLQDGKAKSHWRLSGPFGIFYRVTGMSGIEVSGIQVL